MAPEPISAAYFINPFQQSVLQHSACAHLIAGRQRFAKDVTTAKNTHAATTKLLDEPFSMAKQLCEGLYRSSTVTYHDWKIWMKKGSQFL
jgi:hypothetical protein